MPATIDLLAISRGAVVAPAGCGKTQAIVDAVTRHDGRPILVLTHTNAGVSALRGRLQRARTAAASCRVATLDGWALQVVRAFPELAGHRPDLAAIHYPTLQDAVVRAIESGAIDPILRATYSRLIVDEYQDCGATQHRLVVALAARLPTVVLGDSLQRIFDFAGALPNWAGEVLRDFPLVGQLDHPHRWTNAGEAAFGRWVLDIRPGLIAGQGVDLATAPANVRWLPVPTSAHQASAEQTAIAGLQALGGQAALIIGDARDRQSRVDFAARHDGVEVVEPVDMPGLTAAAGRIQATTGPARINEALSFARSAVTGIDQALELRLTELAAGRLAPASDADRACVAAVQDPSLRRIASLLETLAAEPQRRVFRPDFLSAMSEGARQAETRQLSLVASVIAVREARRSLARRLPARAIGSTLLLKGLEADHAVILLPGRMTSCHLYVALTRACRSLLILSDRQHIGI